MTKEKIEQRRQQAKTVSAKEREREWSRRVLDTVDDEDY